MEIQVGKFWIVSDQTGFKILTKGIGNEGTKREGEEIINIEGNYSDMTAALVGLHRHICLCSDATTLKELLDEIKDFKIIVRTAIDPNEFPALFHRKRKI